MLCVLASCIMRTTIDLAEPVLEELKALQRKEGGSLGVLASRLLAESLSLHRSKPDVGPELRWSSGVMSARVDLADKEALYRELDRR